MPLLKALEPGVLYQRCDPEQFQFTTTAELDDLLEIVGQDRVVRAVHFGIGIRQQGYNLFALGPHGTGKHTAVRQFLEQKAATKAVPSDWCYVFNFEQPHRPRALRLPPGQGHIFAQDMKQLVDGLFTVIPAAFESDEYHNQRKAVEAEFQARQEATFEEISRQAQARGVALIRTPAGMAFAPMRDGEVVGPEDFMKLPPEEQKRLEAEVASLQEQLQRAIREAAQWIREVRERVKSLNQEVATFAIAPLFEELKSKEGRPYSDLPDLLDYLQEVQTDVVENADKFVAGQERAQASPLGPRPQQSPDGAPPFGPDGAPIQRYQVNELVDNSSVEGAPVVYEDLPSYQNLVGRIEHTAQMGALMTDFTLIKSGALHRANGGYLILDAHKVLLQPYAWEGLKRALRAGTITVETLGQMFSLISTVTLEPEPIPLDVKVVLLGERLLYYLLHQFDADFGELFKVAADFEDQMDRNSENNDNYAHLIASLARRDGLRHFERGAVARVIEHSARLAGDSEKLTAHMQSVTDLLRESSYWAGEAGREVVEAADVQQAISAQVYRNSRLRERMQEQILREVVLIDTDGAKISQINGLSVLTVGNYAFGRPSRITARIRMGKGEVVDIERQVELGGPIHSKGVLILASYLGARYALERPLSISASLVFEQSYAGVEGDSASSAELYALLSALGDVPIKQSLAVTGSVNQHGQVQAIGGVNEKIEGFFDLCQARGLTGEQGVLIPASNVKHLMLRSDVVEAVAAGQFHIYPVTTIDEGIELLTGVPAGEPDESGHFPEGTINQRVEAKLAALAEKQRAWAAESRQLAEEKAED